MPLDGKQLDELLSGFVDGELTDEERELVDTAARTDVRVAQQIELLRRQSSWVQQVGQAVAHDPGGKPGGVSLALRVIAEAQQRGRELGLPATHHVQLGVVDVVQLPAAASHVTNAPASSTRPRKSSNRRIEAWLALGGLAAAAAVLVAIMWPKLQQQDLLSTPSNQLAQHDAQPEPQLGVRPDQRSADKLADGVGLEELTPAESLASRGTPPQAEATSVLAGDKAAAGEVAAGSSLVGMTDRLAYALVVDVEVTAQAAKSRMLEKLLTAAGIPLAPPVAVNTEILKALDDSRLVVHGPTSAVHTVSIQVVRGGLHELDGALRRVWQDSDNFPNVGLNLSIDSRAALMREMLRSSGDRFAPTDRFAVPLAFDQGVAPSSGDPILADVATGRASPLKAADAGVQYVSSGQREGGWESLGELAGTTPQSLTTILLVIHYAD